MELGLVRRELPGSCRVLCSCSHHRGCCSSPSAHSPCSAFSHDLISRSPLSRAKGLDKADGFRYGPSSSLPVWQG